MKKDNGLYRLVYEYYEARILLGCYTCGDKLPSIPKISDIFHLAPTTIRSALSMLEQEELIKVDARKAAVVTYDLSPGQMNPEGRGSWAFPNPAPISWNPSGKRGCANGMTMTGNPFAAVSWTPR